MMTTAAQAARFKYLKRRCLAIIISAEIIRSRWNIANGIRNGSSSLTLILIYIPITAIYLCEIMYYYSLPVINQFIHIN